MPEMPRTLEQFHRDAISGERRTPSITIICGTLGVIEPFYTSIVAARNRLFDRGILTAHRADRPVISVGNITTGGTGKTPVVRWMVEQSIAAGLRPAILLRGYKGGEEQRMLQSHLPGTIVEANPSRVQGARDVLLQNPQTDLFILDDGFQHRKLVRDFDLVLIDATNPFGHGHVLPRGLLREPLSGLARASAFLITHTELGEDPSIETTLRKHNSSAPIYRSRHVHTGLRDRNGNLTPLSELTGVKAMTFCGIGNPQSFDRQIAAAGAARVGSHWFGDHHHYTEQDLEMLRSRARELGAQMLITTEKDWIKLCELVKSWDELPDIRRAELAIQFMGEDESRLFSQIAAVIKAIRSADPPAPRGGGRSPVDSRS